MNRLTLLSFVLMSMIQITHCMSREQVLALAYNAPRKTVEELEELCKSQDLRKIFYERLQSCKDSYNLLHDKYPLFALPPLSTVTSERLVTLYNNAKGLFPSIPAHAQPPASAILASPRLGLSLPKMIPSINPLKLFYGAAGTVITSITLYECWRSPKKTEKITPDNKKTLSRL
jgi:hypothetical protein